MEGEPDLIYENYKEPLKKIRKGQGFGYYGTVATTKDKTLIQCHACGELFSTLGGHLRKHSMDAVVYKEKFGLSMTTALVSDSVREAMQQRTIGKLQNGQLPEHLVKYNRDVQNGVIKHDPNNRSNWKLERRNKEGLCPDQVLEKIKELAMLLKHTPSEDEFRNYYGYRYIKSIRYLHGGYLQAVKKAELVSAKELKEPDNDKLLQDLIDFKEEHGRIPMTSDFKRGLLRPRAMYFRRFGSLNNARIEAGLNAVLPMPFGQIVEMSPEEYIKYKERI